MFKGIKVIIQEYLPKLLEPKNLAILAALLLLVVILLAVRRKTRLNTKTLTYGAICISVAFILSFIKILELPNGGTITLASMLPIFIFAYIAGPRAGITAGLCYGLLQAIQDPYIVHWAQFLLDYPIAFSLLGLAGIFRKNGLIGTLAGAVVGATARFACHYLSGIIFFAEYAGDTNVYLYSLLYNGSYLLFDTLICLVVLMIPNLRSAIKRVSTAVL